MDVELVLGLARAFERLLVVIGGILAIWLGYRLFSVVVSDNGAFSAKSGKISLRLQRIGPGVFFAVFGAGILSFAVYHPFTTGSARAPEPFSVNTADRQSASARQEAQGSVRQHRYAGDTAGTVTENSRQEDVVRAITITNNYITRNNDLSGLSAADRAVFNAELSKIIAFRERLIDGLYGNGSASWYLDVYQRTRANDQKVLSALSADDRKKFERIKSLMRPEDDPE